MRDTTTRTIARVVAPYALFAGLWIYFSDTVLLRLVSDPQSLTSLSIYKGMAFVLVTSVLLASLLRFEAAARLRSQSALDESEARLRSIADNLPDSYVYQYTIEPSGRSRFLYVSAGVERLHGVSAAEVMDDATVLLGQIDSEVSQQRTSAEAASLAALSDFGMNLRVQRPDGEQRWLQIRSRPRRRLDGQVVWDGVATDITARKASEDALRLHEALLSEMGRMAKVGGWEFDPTTGKGTWTEEVARIHGLDPADETCLERGLSFFFGESRQRIEQAITGAIQHGRPYDLELEMVTAGGDRKWVRSIGHPTVVDGKTIRVRGSFQDITESKHTEAEIRRLNEELEQRVQERTAELEAVNRELEAFSFSVSHDLRAPLRAIDGFCRILVEDHAARLDADGLRVCGVISRSATDMGRLIDDLLSFSRVGRAAMHASVIDMRRLAESVFGEVTTPEDQARVDFRVGELPPAAADFPLIRQVWANLLSNAVKFSARRDRPHIEVTAETASDEVVYSVRDNGAGFDMRYADKLFGVFQRLHSAREFEGTGVGLAIVQRIVARHGGRVWADSVPDRGATFCFSLPKEAGHARV